MSSRMRGLAAIISLLAIIIGSAFLAPWHTDIAEALQPAQPACTSPCGLDIVFVLDVSGSMGGTPLDYLKEGVHSFINATCPDGGWAIGIVAFNDTAYNLTSGLLLVNSDAVKKNLNDTVDTLTAGGLTALGYGIGNGTAMFLDTGRPGVNRVMIIFTDGEPNVPSQAENYATQKANEAKANNIAIVGVFAGDPLGTGDEFLQSISDYFINVSIDQLPQAFTSLVSQVCRISPPTTPVVGAEVRLAQATGSETYSYAVITGIIAIASIAIIVPVVKRKKE